MGSQTTSILEPGTLILAIEMAIPLCSTPILVGEKQSN